ncbi:MAG: hypothetical protein CL846_01275 [Crocinitomicaceae bacterium]|nr:hypothetical protein [Crocinitomicaceae bacterium]|tara:strand:+ start:4639 stop:5355 length:717 start_codon:yes stop_codon:yes gene_type:complete
MKNIIYLLSILLIFSSCSQTYLSSSFNKRSKKIYVKPLTKTQFNNDIHNENKTLTYSENKSIKTILEKSFNSKTISNNQEELYVNADVSKKSVILNENKICKKLIRIDSILKSNDSTLTVEDEILKISNRAKKFSLLGVVSSLNTGLIYILHQLLQPRAFFPSILFLISSIASLILFAISKYNLISAIRRMKKNGIKANNQIKENIKIAFRAPLFIFICCIIIGIIVALTFSVSVSII